MEGVRGYIYRLGLAVGWLMWGWGGIVAHFLLTSQQPDCLTSSFPSHSSVSPMSVCYVCLHIDASIDAYEHKGECLCARVGREISMTLSVSLFVCVLFLPFFLPPFVRACVYTIYGCVCMYAYARRPSSCLFVWFIRRCVRSPHLHAPPVRLSRLCAYVCTYVRIYETRA